jgi:nitrogen fixation protein FixH
MSSTSTKAFTGYHMAAILIGFFGIVIAVNIYMAKVAIGTFGGTVVDNSYVASQNYNEWLAEAEKGEKLGWSVSAKRAADGKLTLTVGVNGASGTGFTVNATAEHPLGRMPERVLQFAALGNGNYVSEEALPSGRWLLRIEVSRGGDRYRATTEVK